MSSWETTTVRHGTPSGARLHSSLGERPCDPCYAAKQEYDQRWRSSESRQIKQRINARAQQRAQSELARRHHDEYRELYEAFKADLLAAHEAAS